MRRQRDRQKFWKGHWEGNESCRNKQRVYNVRDWLVSRPRLWRESWGLLYRFSRGMDAFANLKPWPQCKPSKKNHANRNHSERWTMACMERGRISIVNNNSQEQGEACGLPKEKGGLCFQVHVALGLLNGWGPRPKWPEMFRSRKDPPPPHQGPVSGVRNAFLLVSINPTHPQNQGCICRSWGRDFIVETVNQSLREQCFPPQSQCNKEWNDT